jgi:hypothetical protein
MTEDKRTIDVYAKLRVTMTGKTASNIDMINTWLEGVNVDLPRLHSTDSNGCSLCIDGGKVIGFDSDNDIAKKVDEDLRTLRESLDRISYALGIEERRKNE